VCALTASRYAPYCHIHTPITMKNNVTFGDHVVALHDINRDTKIADFKVGTIKVPHGTKGKYIWSPNKKEAYDTSDKTRSIAGAFNRQTKENPANARIKASGAVFTTKNIAKGDQVFVTGYGAGYRL